VIELNNDGAGTLLPYNAQSHDVTGVSFTLTGSSVPDEIRPTFFNAASATPYCKRICAPGGQSILLTEAYEDCWNENVTATPTGTTLERLEFSIPSRADEDVTFDFCIEDLTARQSTLSTGDPGICPLLTDPDSCAGLCGSLGDNCYCDSFCLEDLTGCCADFEAVCL